MSLMVRRKITTEETKEGKEKGKQSAGKPTFLTRSCLELRLTAGKGFQREAIEWLSVISGLGRRARPRAFATQTLFVKHRESLNLSSAPDFISCGRWFLGRVCRCQRLSFSGFQPASGFDIGDSDDELLVPGHPIKHLLKRSIIQLRIVNA